MKKPLIDEASYQSLHKTQLRQKTSIGATFIKHIDQDYMFEFIKAVSDTVLDMINAAYHDKPLIFIRAIRLSLSRLFLTLY